MRDPFNQGRRGWDDARRAFKEQMRGMREHGGHFGPPPPPGPPEPPFAEEGRGFGPGFFGPGFGGPGGFGPGFGPGFGFGPGRGRGRGRGHRHSTPGRARRGNVRAAVLMLLAERPMHGYEMIQEITERSGGWWRPSPGSVYPTLQMLADEGLVSTQEQSTSGKRLYSLTETGQAAAAGLDKTPPWEQMADDIDANHVALRQAAMSRAGAVMQIARTGNQEQRTTAVKLLTETRRKIYLLLAEADIDPETPEDTIPEEQDES